MTYRIAADSVGKSFRGRRVLSSATLHVPPGRITALLGRNGCGKSTLLRILIGFLQADHGRIEFEGEFLARPRLGALAARGLFYLPDRDLLSRNRTVRHHLDMLARRFGIGNAGDVVESVGIASLLDRLPGQLSGGERRRAELALALMRRPTCLLADEPFLGIAPRDAEVVATALRTLAAHGCGVLVTGHEVELLLDGADDVVWMTAGTTHPLGAPADVWRYHSFVRDYLGPHHGHRLPSLGGRPG